jgi:hypothetical protein
MNQGGNSLAHALEAMSQKYTTLLLTKQYFNGVLTRTTPLLFLEPKSGMVCLILLVATCLQIED